MLLDPATKNYYDAGLVLGAAVWDLAATLAVPLMTVAALVLVYLPSYALTGHPDSRAVLRLVFLAGASAVALVAAPRGDLLPPDPPSESRTGDRRDRRSDPRGPASVVSDGRRRVHEDGPRQLAFSSGGWLGPSPMTATAVVVVGSPVAVGDRGKPAQHEATAGPTDVDPAVA